MFTDDQTDAFVGSNTTFTIGDPPIEVACNYITGETGVGLGSQSERVEKIMFSEHLYSGLITVKDEIIINETTKTIKSYSRVGGIVVLEL